MQIKIKELEWWVVDDWGGEKVCYNKEIKVKVEHIWRLWGQFIPRITMWRGSWVTQRCGICSDEH